MKTKHHRWSRCLVMMLGVGCIMGVGLASAFALEPAESIARKFRNRINLNANVRDEASRLVGAIIRLDALMQSSSKLHGNPEPWHDDHNNDPVAKAADNLDIALDEFLDVVELDYDLMSAADRVRVRSFMNLVAQEVDDLDIRLQAAFGKSSNSDTRDRLILIIEDLNADV